jgi:hypothetical protein
MKHKMETIMDNFPILRRDVKNKMSKNAESLARKRRRKEQRIDLKKDQKGSWERERSSVTGHWLGFIVPRQSKKMSKT